mgnify:CR=1 FL=1
MFKKLKVNLIKFKTYRDGDDDGGGEGGEGGETKTFTQEEVEGIVTKRLSKQKQEVQKTKEENTQLLENMKTLEKSVNLSKKERADLSSQIETLEKQVLTKEELAQKEQNKLVEEHNSKLKKAESESSEWKNRFERSTLQRALSDAAVATNAESPEQIQMMFQNNSFLEEVKDDNGKATGSFKPMLKFHGIDPDSDDQSMKEMTLPVGEAMSKIKEDGIHKNLFRHGAKAGTGNPQGNSGKGNNADPDKMPEIGDFNGNQEQFRAAYSAWRDKQRQKG